jgi:hypothetical protein
MALGDNDCGSARPMTSESTLRSRWVCLVPSPPRDPLAVSCYRPGPCRRIAVGTQRAMGFGVSPRSGKGSGTPGSPSINGYGHLMVFHGGIQPEDLLRCLRGICSPSRDWSARKFGWSGRRPLNNVAIEPGYRAL